MGTTCTQSTSLSHSHGWGALDLRRRITDPLRSIAPRRDAPTCPSKYMMYLNCCCSCGGMKFCLPTEMDVNLCGLTNVTQPSRVNLWREFHDVRLACSISGCLAASSAHLRRGFDSSTSYPVADPQNKATDRLSR